jgi:dTDP-4-amino-4,6-dideoxygalactose transaminase
VKTRKPPSKPRASSLPFIDLGAHHAPIKKEMLAKVAEIIDRSQFILGPEVEAFEREFATYCGAKHGVGVSNGYDALRLSLEAMGIGAGDEVIVPTFTFAATAFAVTHAGATPVFVDVDPVTLTMDAEKARAEVGPKTKAIMPVHLFGCPADMDAIVRLGRDKGLRVIEDAAQAHGARIGGKRVGSIGDVGCFSFYPSKNLGALGDGGAVVTDSAELAKRVATLRNCGSVERYVHEFVGYNNRLDNVQAAWLRLKLARLDEMNRRRRKVAALYDELLTEVRTPLARPGAEHVYHLYVVRSSERDRLKERLAAAGIPCGVYYPVPLHLQPCYKSLGYKEGECPVAEHAAKEVLALPIWPEMSASQVKKVVSALQP